MYIVCTCSGVTGFNKTALTTTGLIKKIKGKKNNVMYMIIEDIGSQTNMRNYVGKEMPLDDLIGLRFSGNNQTMTKTVNPSQTSSEFKFCSVCGNKLKQKDKFCTKCGNKV